MQRGSDRLLTYQAWYQHLSETPPVRCAGTIWFAFLEVRDSVCLVAEVKHRSHDVLELLGQ